jgi:hypothetical protein
MIHGGLFVALNGVGFHFFSFFSREVLSLIWIDEWCFDLRLRQLLFLSVTGTLFTWWTDDNFGFFIIIDLGIFGTFLERCRVLLMAVFVGNNLSFLIDFIIAQWISLCDVLLVLLFFHLLSEFMDLTLIVLFGFWYVSLSFGGIVFGILCNWVGHFFCLLIVNELKLPLFDVFGMSLCWTDIGFYKISQLVSTFLFGWAVWWGIFLNVVSLLVLCLFWLVEALGILVVISLFSYNSIFA